MIRTQVYIAENERTILAAIAQNEHKSQSELIRQAIDFFCAHKLQNNCAALLQSAKGLWRERQDLPDFNELRKEFDRFSKSHGTGLADALIAATAVFHHATLVTFNTAAFH